MLDTHLHLNAILMRRTSGRTLGTFKQSSAQSHCAQNFPTSSCDSDVLTARSFRRTAQTAACCSAGISPDSHRDFSWFSAGQGLQARLALTALSHFPSCLYVLKRFFPYCCWHVPEPQMHTASYSHSVTCLLFAHCSISTPPSVCRLLLGHKMDERSRTIWRVTQCHCFRGSVISVRCLISWYCLSETVLTMVTMATNGSKCVDYYRASEIPWELNKIRLWTGLPLSPYPCLWVPSVCWHHCLKVVTPCSLAHIYRCLGWTCHRIATGSRFLLNVDKFLPDCKAV